MHLMHTVLSNSVNKTVIVFLDDIQIYSKKPADHEKHSRKVPGVLQEHKLYGRLSECSFAQKSIEFLGHIFSAQVTSVDPNKIAPLTKLLKNGALDFEQG